MKRNGDVNPLLSVIVPFFNSEKYLKKCIDSLINQKFSNYELLLIDDCSTDDSKAIALDFDRKFKNIHYIEGNGNGVSDARNVGVSFSQGKYISFVDSDDSVKEDFFNKIIPFLDENNPDVVFFNFEEVKDGKKFVNDINLTHNIKADLDDSIESILSNKGYKGFCWNKIYRREFVANCKFNTHLFYLEDMVFNIDVLSEVENVFFMNEVLYEYYWRSDSAVNKFSSKQLTYIEALNYIEEKLPRSFYKDIILRKAIAYVNFSSFFIFNNRKMFQKLKREFKSLENVSKKSKSISKIDKIIVITAERNFFVAVLLYRMKRMLLNSYLFSLFKTKIKKRK